MRSLAIAALTVLAVGFTNASGSPAANPNVFADCLGQPQVKPTDIILACGDGNSALSSLRWTGWGGTFTAARGIATINDCKPDCVDGTSHDYPVIVVLSGRQICKPGGELAYLTLTLAFADGRPHVTASQRYPCRLRS